MKDYYRILGVNKNASTTDIKKTFKKKALLVHPDKSGKDTKNEFIELFEAYEILVDQKRREKYDLIYDWIGTPTAEQNGKELMRDILSIHEKGLEYARNFKKFNKEVIIYMLLDMLFSKFMLGAVALTIIGIWTIGKGIINFELDYCLIGVVMTMIGIWFAKIRLDWIVREASR
jgi:DnaJ-class molecular chaperone